MSKGSGKVAFYSDILGQDEVIRHLKSYLRADGIPHALLFVGEDGGEAFPLALAFIRHILCMHPTEDGACGVCTSCKQLDTLTHPDLYPIFPVVKVGDKESVSADVMESFRRMVLEQERFTYNEWKSLQKSGNKQLSILVAEAERLIHFTSLKSFQSKHQVVLIWMPEQMRTDTANKLLKLLEEPPEGVLFIAVCHQPDRLLPTIRSRFQQITVPPISEEVLVRYLHAQHALSPDEGAELGHLAQGNLYRALKLHSEGYKNEKLEQALHFLELPMSRDPRLYQKEVDSISKLNRPQVLDLLNDVLGLLREVLACSQGIPSIVYTPSIYRERLQALGKFFSLDTLHEFMADLQAASAELRQNANIKIVFFDLFLHLSFIYARQR